MFGSTKHKMTLLVNRLPFYSLTRNTKICVQPPLQTKTNTHTHKDKNSLVLFLIHFAGLGQYLYIEASGKNESNFADLRSAFIPEGYEFCLTFFTNMYGESMGSVDVMVQVCITFQLTCPRPKHTDSLITAAIYQLLKTRSSKSLKCC